MNTAMTETISVNEKPFSLKPFPTKKKLFFCEVTHIVCLHGKPDVETIKPASLATLLHTDADVDVFLCQPLASKPPNVDKTKTDGHHTLVQVTKNSCTNLKGTSTAVLQSLGVLRVFHKSNFVGRSVGWLVEYCSNQCALRI